MSGQLIINFVFSSTLAADPFTARLFSIYEEAEGGAGPNQVNTQTWTNCLVRARRKAPLWMEGVGRGGRIGAGDLGRGGFGEGREGMGGGGGGGEVGFRLEIWEWTGRR